jgi:N-acetyl-gamma-glutamyl-phosphate reductase common form
MTDAVGIIGARGHVGAELIRLLAAHPRLELAFVSSRELQGQRVADHVDVDVGDLRYTALEPGDPRSHADAVVLALPNGHSDAWVAGLARAGRAPIVLDLSADHRFDEGWHYGLPELSPMRSHRHRRISNPGCYATAMQLAIAPMLGMLEGTVQSFGVSGYSGAGTAPSDRNDPDKLRDNLMPYALTGHVHEREASARLGQLVDFMPHVAAHFRGLSVTVNMRLARRWALDDIVQRYRMHYAGEPLVHVHGEVPWIKRVAGHHHADVGGFSIADGGRRLVVVCVLDNLLKGAATQALQNLNLAFGLGELTGIPHLGPRADSPAVAA